MTAYSRGRSFEYDVRDQLVSEGYECFRSAGSKTKVDVIAIKAGQILLIQAKRDGRISPAERVSIQATAALIDCAVPVLAYKTVGKSAVLLARLTGAGPKDREPFLTDEAAA
jgi:Holliday junction resolvase